MGCYKSNSKMSLKLMKLHYDLAQTGSLVTIRALVSQVLLGLDEEYNLVVVVIQSKPNITWLDIQFELLSFEKRLEHQNNTKCDLLRRDFINVMMLTSLRRSTKSLER